ncbi:MAG: SemiSWEET transporter [Vulcanococcus sp.]|jgi:MtN3 and saliva related transmembrane protein|uniref:SemiSWEET transporter n=1 Tax=Vulcanococcus sp. TaxID=2856995 RepID=UPI0025CB97CB|nr:SemiSWEET transporter [Vulcanococcus sp.]MBW0166218.1 SemiSWEET transporter [Vulcanococcus sp.]
MSAHPPAIAALGYVAASLTTLSFIPQAIKTLRTGDTRGISLRMYALFTAGIALWGVYGLLTGDGPLIVANAITLVAAGLILDRKWRAWWSERQADQRLRGGKPLP